MARLTNVYFISLALAAGPSPILTGNPFHRVGTGSSPGPKYKVREVKILAQPEIACPNGFERTAGNICLLLESLPAKKRCPGGWETNGNTCVGYATAPPDYTCDEGVAHGNACSKQSSVPKVLQCPEGYSLQSDLHTCTKHIQSRPWNICPPGVREVNGQCIITEKEQPHLRCPSGFHLESQMCEQLLENAPKTFCPPLYQLVQNGKSCQREIVKPASMKCPNAYKLVGKDCLKESRIPPNWVCRKGKLVDGNRCAIYHKTSPEIHCPHGLGFNDLTLMCERDDVRNPIPECSKGSMYNPMTNQCGSANKLKHPNLICPPDYHFVGKTSCVRHIVEHPKKVCPTGYELLSKDECQKQELKLPEGRCPIDSHLVESWCITTSSAEYDYLCENGGVLQGKNCLSVAMTHPSKECLNEQVLTEEDICLSKMVKAPTVTCPEGTTQQTTVSGTLTCLVSRRSSAKKKCPAGSRMQGDDKCLEDVEASPTLICPRNYFEDLVSGLCFKVEELPKRTTCPRGYKLMGDHCLHREETLPLPECPPRYKLEGEDKCVKETIETPISICPFGYELDDDICLSKKLQYDFDVESGPDSLTEAHEEANLPMESPLPGPTAAPAAATEVTIEIRIDRPIVQKGLVMRNEPIVLSGPASEVARQQAKLAAGGRVEDLGPNVNIEYIPPVVAAGAGRLMNVVY